MTVGSWHLTGVGQTLAMAFALHLPWHRTNDQFPFVLRGRPGRCLTGAYLDFAENGQGKESEQYGDIFKKYKDQYNCCNDAHWVPSICIVNGKLGEYVVWTGVRMEDT
ncbi:hypothetical protein B0H11DRAFT_1922941 [Mycena galericulata]|nr:hypothetical protein B0H11DRAFT_1922941 [Mycena galericulata]